jgi:hypothetical protein
MRDVKIQVLDLEWKNPDPGIATLKFGLERTINSILHGFLEITNLPPSSRILRTSRLEVGGGNFSNISYKSMIPEYIILRSFQN